MGEPDAADVSSQLFVLCIHSSLQRVPTFVSALSVRDFERVRGPRRHIGQILSDLSRASARRFIVPVCVLGIRRQTYRRLGGSDDCVLIPNHGWNMGWILRQLARPIRIIPGPRDSAAMVQIQVEN